MWRNTVLSSRLLYSSNPNPFSPARSISRPYLYSSTRITDPSSSTPYSFSPEQVEVGFNKSDAVQALQFGAVDSSSLAALSVSKVRDVVDLARHYGRCYWELSKARLSMLVVATSGTGFVLGSGSTVDVPGLCFTCVGTMMVAASANSLNQVFEINNDAKMKRTKLRPLPSGRITVPHAITWASSIGVAGTALLACQANTLAAGLAATNLVLYAFIYTPLKQVHPVNTWVGAVVGAIPPLLGWAAASGQISLNAMILPAALYFWQIPHFMALAYLCRDDYAAGGFRMFSLADASGQRTASVALRNCIYLIPLGFLAYDWGMASGWFCLESSLLTLAITATAFKFYQNRTKATARRMFHASLLYLPVFMSGILFHRLSTDEHCLGGEELNGIIEPSFTSETDVLPENEYLRRDRVKQTANTRARPPVAFASVAPFPFLPAPCYDSY